MSVLGMVGALVLRLVVLRVRSHFHVGVRLRTERIGLDPPQTPATHSHPPRFLHSHQNAGQQEQATPAPPPPYPHLASSAQSKAPNREKTMKKPTATMLCARGKGCVLIWDVHEHGRTACGGLRYGICRMGTSSHVVSYVYW
jgi:hypothetical protein